MAVSTVQESIEGYWGFLVFTHNVKRKPPKNHPAKSNGKHILQGAQITANLRRVEKPRQNIIREFEIREREY